MVRRSAAELRKKQIEKQIEHLRAQLSVKSRKDYTSDYRYETWRIKSYELIDELLEELSSIDDPGEYDDLPLSVVADELGLGLGRVRSLIRLGEIEANGKSPRQRVSRQELARILEIEVPNLLKLASQDAHTVFEGLLPHVQSGNLALAEIAFRRLKGRESCIGLRTLAVKTALHLHKGRYDEACSATLFVKRNCPTEEIIYKAYLQELLRNAVFTSDYAQEIGRRILSDHSIIQASFTIDGVPDKQYC